MFCCVLRVLNVLGFFRSKEEEGGIGTEKNFAWIQKGKEGFLKVCGVLEFESQVCERR